MRKIFTLAAIVLAAGLVCSCAKAPEEKAAADAAVQSKEQAAGDIYEKLLSLQSDPVEMIDVKGDMLMDFYGIDPADIADGVFGISVDNMRADEFAVVRAASEEAAGRLEQKLKDRMQLKLQEATGYSPVQASIIKNSGVVREGLDLALICGPDYESMKKAYEQMIR